MESNEGSNKRRRLMADPEGSITTPSVSDVARPGPSGLSAIRSLGVEMQKNLFGMLDIRTAKVLAQVDKTWNNAVSTHTVATQVTGMRGVGDQLFWTLQPSTEPKRYFKKMDVFGNVRDVPHISEQTGHPSHVTDVVSMNWPTPGSGLPGGHYPSKVQYQENPFGPRSRRSYSLGTVDLPVKPQQGRVLTLAPPAAKEPPNTYIETKSLNKASKGPLPSSYPRTRLDSTQVRRRLSESQAQFENQPVRIFEKPTR